MRKEMLDARCRMLEKTPDAKYCLLEKTKGRPQTRIIQHLASNIQHPTSSIYLLLCIMYNTLCITSCTPVQQTPTTGTATTSPDYAGEKRLRYEDAEYEPGIRTALLYPNAGQATDPMQPAVLSLGAGSRLRLEFDEMGAQYYNYYFKIVPCTWNWKPGLLQDMEIVEQYNEFVMDGYELSSGTRVPFVHYFATIPPVKLSGNYLLMVYRNGNKDDLVITRRFVVFENQMSIAPEIKFAAGVEQRFSHQQVDFTLNYSAYPIYNPTQTIKVVVRQNGRWDNALMGLAPFFIRDDEKVLDFHHVDLSNAFEGNNEWRNFDIRSIRFRGFNVAALTFNNTRADAYLSTDASRNVRNYTYFVDANGRYVVGKAETDDAALNADYVNTHFTLTQPANLPPGKVYIFGAISDWQLKPAFRMQPDSANPKNLVANVLLKQGFYNYEYAFLPEGATKLELTPLEGSYSLTENYYEVLVYVRPIGARYDQMVGYNRVSYNAPR